MIIAGNCSYIDELDEKEIVETAEALSGFADVFRCKVWLGGTRPDKYMKGIGERGLKLLTEISQNIMPVYTEVQTPAHIFYCARRRLDGIWIGARNSQNYGLLESLNEYWDEEKPIYIKRGAGMTIDETIGLYDIMEKLHYRSVGIIERGINTFDRLEDSRWSPDLKGVIRIKHERTDIFDSLVIDCSHSVGRSEYIQDTYNAFKAVGCRNFMFEVTKSGKSRTDQRSMLSASELGEILNGSTNNM